MNRKKKLTPHQQYLKDEKERIEQDKRDKKARQDAEDKKQSNYMSQFIVKRPRTPTNQKIPSSVHRTPSQIHDPKHIKLTKDSDTRVFSSPHIERELKVIQDDDVFLENPCRDNGKGLDWGVEVETRNEMSIEDVERMEFDKNMARRLQEDDVLNQEENDERLAKQLQAQDYDMPEEDFDTDNMVSLFFFLLESTSIIAIKLATTIT